MPDTLESRFNQFLADFPGAEVIDDYMRASEPDSRKRADYLLRNRQVIVEIKTIVDDPSSKIDAEVSKHANRDDFPICYGQVDLQDILNCLPDGESINRRIHGLITRSVEQGVRSAEEQIQGTKEIFNLDNSVGLLVILNESTDILSPDVVAHRIASLMTRERTGLSTAPTLDFVWLVFESHVIQIQKGLNAFVSLRINGPTADRFSWFESFFDQLQQSWSNANYGIRAVPKNFEIQNVRFESSAQEKANYSKHVPSKP